MNTDAFLIIDAQVNMFDPAHAVHGAAAVLSRLEALVAGARAAGRPVVFVRNCGSTRDRAVPKWWTGEGRALKPGGCSGFEVMVCQQWRPVAATVVCIRSGLCMVDLW